MVSVDPQAQKAVLNEVSDDVLALQSIVDRSCAFGDAQFRVVNSIIGDKLKAAIIGSAIITALKWGDYSGLGQACEQINEIFQNIEGITGLSKAELIKYANATSTNISPNALYNLVIQAERYGFDVRERAEGVREVAKEIDKFIKEAPLYVLSEDIGERRVLGIMELSSILGEGEADQEQRIRDLYLDLVKTGHPAIIQRIRSDNGGQVVAGVDPSFEELYGFWGQYLYSNGAGDVSGPTGVFFKPLQGNSTTLEAVGSSLGLDNPLEVVRQSFPDGRFQVSGEPKITQELKRAEGTIYPLKFTASFNPVQRTSRTV
jgi:hypothetical protein